MQHETFSNLLSLLCSAWRGSTETGKIRFTAVAGVVIGEFNQISVIKVAVAIVVVQFSFLHLQNALALGDASRVLFL